MCGTTQHHLACQTCCSLRLYSHPLLVESICKTSGVRGGALLMVHTVLRLENHELVTPVRDKTARLASSPACDKWAVNPCLAAMVVIVERQWVQVDGRWERKVSTVLWSTTRYFRPRMGCCRGKARPKSRITGITGTKLGWRTTERRVDIFTIHAQVQRIVRPLLSHTFVHHW